MLEGWGGWRCLGVGARALCAHEACLLCVCMGVGRRVREGMEWIDVEAFLDARWKRPGCSLGFWGRARCGLAGFVGVPVHAEDTEGRRGSVVTHCVYVVVAS